MGQPKLYTLLMIMLISMILRIIPHWPNFTPMMVFAVYLAATFSRTQALLLLFISVFICDFILSQHFSYSVFGSWSLFTYSAYALIILGVSWGVKSGIKQSHTPSLFELNLPPREKFLARRRNARLENCIQTGGGYHLQGLFSQSCFATLFFWVWTNAGTWWMSGLYPHDQIGLLDCYVLAWPFLENAVLGTLFWFGVMSFYIGNIGEENSSRLPHLKYTVLRPIQ